jgi:hypothetical protein
VRKAWDPFVKKLTDRDHPRCHRHRGLSAWVGALALLGASSQSSGQPPATSRQDWDLETDFLRSPPALLWGKDPFRKHPGHAPSEETEPKYELTAVIHDGVDSEAIINETRLTVGDEVGWRTVVEIGANYVLLDDGFGSLIELNLPFARRAPGSIELEEAKASP